MKNLILLHLFLLITCLLHAQHRSPAVLKQSPVIDPTQLNGPPPDITPPEVVCLNNIDVDLASGGLISLWASDFLQYAQDNQTPAALIKLGIRKSGTGSGFPVDLSGNPITNVNFNCSELGYQQVEIWAIDEAGNAAYCETGLTLSDPSGFCDPLNQGALQVCVSYGCDDTPMPGVDIQLSGGFPIPPFLFDSVTGADGCVRFVTDLYVPHTLTLDKDDDPLNGVTSLDLMLISRHIAGIEPLDSPYKLIAADANKSGSISTFDIVELRKLLMGIYTWLPNNTSWRFIDADFVFPNPNNPFMTVFPETIQMDPADPDTSYAFKAIKIGDVDCSASLQPVDYADAFLSFPDTMLVAGQDYDLPLLISGSTTWYGYQFSLKYDPAKMQFQSLTPNQWSGLSDWNVANAGKLTTTWLSPLQAVGFLPDEPVVTLHVKALVDGALSELISLDPQTITPYAYAGPTLEIRDLLLQFVPQLQSGIGQERTVDANVSFASPYPNPGAGNVFFPVSLKTADRVGLKVLDVNGTLIWEQTVFSPAGRQVLEIPEQAFPHAGVYGWQLSVGGQVYSGKLLR